MHFFLTRTLFDLKGARFGPNRGLKYESSPFNEAFVKIVIFCFKKICNGNSLLRRVNKSTLHYNFRGSVQFASYWQRLFYSAVRWLKFIFFMKSRQRAFLQKVAIYLIGTAKTVYLKLSGTRWKALSQGSVFAVPRSRSLRVMHQQMPLSTSNLKTKI